jgi:hypothetical protein
MDGRIILWELIVNEQNKLILEKYFEYNITFEEINKAIINPQF